MSTIGVFLKILADTMAAQVPGRVVTRSYQEFARRKHSDLEAGVWTLLCEGQAQIERYAEHFGAVLVGQIQLGEKATGEEIEEAELAMIDEMRDFCERVKGVQVRPVRWKQSMQIDHPYGWVAVDLDFGPVELTPDSLKVLADLNLVHVDMDIPPFTPEHHQTWAVDEDYTNPPDAQDDIQT
ncbi:hypothetical protein FAZ79_00490 [Guyparkeria sp. SB14A]|uniref:hypothetical protein n=1 Tax=Guyparkeria sp. SB14A TaxID=2571147 RepID=UPI0010ACBBFC|nr:hypothetical protein [Guyparkeria sp. SB14A]TKA91817.1 hypothetical protein FAZ79_00490 [Guyparkeria sp. SB14A]